MQRDTSIDTLRGLACILLVINHVVGGLKLPEHNLYQELIDGFKYIRMPLFTFLSGIVYSYRPFNSKHIKPYLKGKFNRLIIPMLIIGTVFALLQYFTAGTNGPSATLYTIHLYPVSYLWFIESLFLIFIMMIFIERFNFLSKLEYSVVTISVFILVGPFFSDISIFSIKGVFYLMPYFLFGVVVSRFSLTKYTNLFFLNFIVGFFVISLLLANNTSFIDIGSPRTSYTATIIGCISCFLLLNLKLKNRFLASIGVFSYTIYLYHGFLTAGTRIVLSSLGVSSIEVIIIVGTVLGLFIPIVIDKVFSLNNHSSFYLLGRKTKLENKL